MHHTKQTNIYASVHTYKSIHFQTAKDFYEMALFCEIDSIISEQT